MPPQALKICYYNRLLNESWGCGVHGQALASAWAAAGHDVLCLPNDLADSHDSGNRSVGRLAWLPPAVHVPIQDVHGRLIAASRSRQLAERISAFCPDLLIARRAYYDYGLDAVLDQARRPYLAEVNAVLADEMATIVRAPVLPWERSRERAYLKHASAAVCVSEQVRSQLSALGIPDSRLMVLPNGADTSLFAPYSPPDPETAHWAARFGRVFGFAGTIPPMHDTEGLLAALRLVADRLPDAGFLFVGPTMADLANASSQGLPQSERMRCTGRVPHNMVPRHLVCADILWASYRGDYVSPLKLYEYLALARPVVIAASGQTVDVVRDADAGEVVPRGRPSDLAEAAIMVAQLSQDELGRRGASGRIWIEKGHTWSSVANDFLDIGLRAVGVL